MSACEGGGRAAATSHGILSGTVICGIVQEKLLEKPGFSRGISTAREGGIIVFHGDFVHSWQFNYRKHQTHPGQFSKEVSKSALFTNLDLKICKCDFWTLLWKLFFSTECPFFGAVNLTRVLLNLELQKL